MGELVSIATLSTARLLWQVLHCSCKNAIVDLAVLLQSSSYRSWCYWFEFVSVWVAHCLISHDIVYNYILLNTLKLFFTLYSHGTTTK